MLDLKKIEEKWEAVNDESVPAHETAHYAACIIPTMISEIKKLQNVISRAEKIIGHEMLV